ncbi:hypothetical protein L208DRAFT_1020766, partial [Tricholoma matsutake]
PTPPRPFVGPVITASCSCCFLQSLRYLVLSCSLACAGCTLIRMNFSELFLVTSLATFVNSLIR